MGRRRSVHLGRAKLGRWEKESNGKRKKRELVRERDKSMGKALMSISMSRNHSQATNKLKISLRYTEKAI